VKVLVTGAGGLLAHAMLPALAAAGHEARGIDRAEADVTRLDALIAAARAFRPAWIFHFAAWAKVDDCEADPDRAFLVNGLGARNAALAAAESGSAVLAVSSDYVFDGRAGAPYREYDAVAPLQVYGASKWAGEQAVRETGVRHLIVRTAWLFGPGGGNFVDAILKKARAGESLSVVDDQRGSPTYTPDLAKVLLRLAERAENGTYHCVNAGQASWHDLAMAALRASRLEAQVRRIDSATLGRPARRPTYSVLDTSWCQHATGAAMPSWSDALERHVGARREAR
jgi:dTDP-4-dehydrorhamnose reductase